MNRTAIEHARHRLDKANTAIARLRASTNFPEAEAAWSDFLMAANAVYSKLEQGAKSIGRSEAWFGRKKGERKSDPLLSYLHHARNSDEHSIEPITQRNSGGWALKSGGADSSFQMNGTIGPSMSSLRITPISGAPPFMEIILPHLQLIAVNDSRFKDTFHPPTEHLGERLLDVSPLNIASLFVVYLQSIIAEAEAFIP